MWRIGVVATWLAALGCQFDRPPNIDEPDAHLVDAPPACTADTIVCDDAERVYTECSPTGTILRRIDCPLGCAPDVEKCVDIDPSNGLGRFYDDVTDPPDVALHGQSTIRVDLDFGLMISNGESLDVPYFVHDGIGVFVVRSFDLEGTARVLIESDRLVPIAIIATHDVSIRGSFDLSADGSLAGPTGVVPAACAGTSGLYNGNPPDLGGGGGGGHDPGGSGASFPYPAGGAASAAVEPLRGGCPGGPGGRSTSTAPGAGGGALQVTSRTAIRLTELAVIDASGGGGRYIATTSLSSGSGGGSGGAVLLEAPQVVLDGPGVAISTKGGGGAGAGTGPAHNGADGGINAAPAAGGATSQTSAGGAGGVGFTAPQKGAAPLSNGHEGGGGGGSGGLTVFRTSIGFIKPVNGASVYSRSAGTLIRTRLIP